MLQPCACVAALCLCCSPVPVLQPCARVLQQRLGSFTSTAGKGIDRSLQREATRGQQSATILGEAQLGLMRGALAGVH